MKINGKPVKDPRRRLIICTENVHVEKALKNRDEKKGAPISRVCVAAVAAKDKVPNCTDASINRSRSYIKIGDEWERYNTPPALRDALIAFDSGGKFPVGKYELRPLSPSERKKLGKAHSAPTLKHGRKGKHRHKYALANQVRPRSNFSNFSAEI